MTQEQYDLASMLISKRRTLEYAIKKLDSVTRYSVIDLSACNHDGEIEEFVNDVFDANFKRMKDDVILKLDEVNREFDAI